MLQEDFYRERFHFIFNWDLSLSCGTIKSRGTSSSSLLDFKSFCEFYFLNSTKYKKVTMNPMNSYVFDEREFSQILKKCQDKSHQEQQDQVSVNFVVYIYLPVGGFAPIISFYTEQISIFGHTSSPHCPAIAFPLCIPKYFAYCLPYTLLILLFSLCVFPIFRSSCSHTTISISSPERMYAGSYHLPSINGSIFLWIKWRRLGRLSICSTMRVFCKFLH